MMKKVCKKCLYIFNEPGDTCSGCLTEKKKLDEFLGNGFYVYEFIRTDTNEPFYVGKGKNKRALRKIPNAKEIRLNEIIRELRSSHYDYVVNIVEKNIVDEIEALEIERDLIEEYTFDYGYELKNIIYSDVIAFKKTIKDVWSNEERRQLARENTTKLWKEEDFREKTIEKTKEAMQDEVVKIKCSDAAKKAWDDEEYRAKITEALKRPRKSSPKKKVQIVVKRVSTNETILDLEGMTNAKNELAKIGIGSKKFAKLKLGETVEDLVMTVSDEKR